MGKSRNKRVCHYWWKYKNVYAVGPTQTIAGSKAYTNLGGSPWATSNVMAKVAGVTKTNTSVFPEKRGSGYCARLETRMESVKVFGLVDITVLAAGSMFLGTVHEPIKGTKNPNKMLGMGIPFTKRPIALQFDYKVKMSDRENRIRATGFSKITDVPGKIFLQRFCFYKSVGKMLKVIFLQSVSVRWLFIIIIPVIGIIMLPMRFTMVI